MQTYSDKTSNTSNKLLIEFNDTSVSFGNLEALKDITLKINSKDFYISSALMVQVKQR